MDHDEPGGTGKRDWRDFFRRIHRPAWLTTPILAVIGVAVVVGLVFLGRYIHHSLISQPTTTSGGSGQVVPPIAKQPSASSSGSAGSSSNSSSSSTKPSTPGQSTTQLPNSGPGNVVAIFLASSLGAAGLHYVVRSRKNS